MDWRSWTAAGLLFFIFLNLLLIAPAAAQDEGKPIRVTFGQPNIWSLEQAHYLLAQMRERSLGLRAKTLPPLDPNEVNAVRLNLIRQLFGLSTEYRQIPTLENPASSPLPTPTPLQTPVPFPSPSADPGAIPNSVLAELLKDKDFVRKLFGDAKLNATTQLDNHIQLQYEVIAKQLTLLRDEIGPDERLVFLELPQSIYSTPGKADNKVVQVYWQIAGFGRVLREQYLEAKLDEITTRIADSQNDQKVKDMTDRMKVLTNQVPFFKKAADKAEGDLREAEEGLTSCSDPESDACRTAKSNVEEREREYRRARDAYEREKQLLADLVDVIDNLNNVGIREAEEELERLKQGGMRKNEEIIKETRAAYRAANHQSGATLVRTTGGDDALRLRTIDIIPRQSSLNVNDIQETTKSTVLSAAFSFLFGFGARTTYQRQSDQFEQYIHQELYASGFGKGEKMFGWTFGPVPGTKRVAPGVRTTYAVLIVPREAESVILESRGCYFPRKNYQPENAFTMSRANDDWWDKRRRECSAPPQEFVLPIPNGGDAQGFWLMSMDFSAVKKGNQRLVASINGRNFTQQVGVLVDGVPLQQVVELSKKLPDRELLEDYCKNGICGAYEVIDSNEITIAFQMPPDYKGTPEITVIGPGRSVSVNRVKLNRIQVGRDKFYNVRLSDPSVPYMFGERPEESLSINDLVVLSQSAQPAPEMTALLTGTKFENSQYEEVSINGTALSRVKSEFLSSEITG